MFVILVHDDESWSQVAIAASLEEALSVASENCQIEEWMDDNCTIVRPGVVP